MMKKYRKWILVIILLLQLAAAVFFCREKYGYHYDEYYSYYSSNVTWGLVPTDREFKPGGEIAQEFCVLPEERFQYARVVQMQTYDVHPPLYYLLLHTVCSLTPGSFSKWQELSLNLLLYCISFGLLADLCLQSTRRNLWLTGAILAAYGFSPAVMSGIMLARMYCLLGLLILAAADFHVHALQNGLLTDSRPLYVKRKAWTGFLLPVCLCVMLGFLTHYYYAVFMFFLAAAMEMLLLFGQPLKTLADRWKDCIVYGCCVVMGLVLAIVLYPSALRHIFRGYRGTEAMGAFFDAGNTADRIRFFAGLLQEYAFGGMLTFLALAFLLLLVTAWAIHRLRKNRQTEKTDASKPQGPAGRLAAHGIGFVLSISVIGYFLVVAKTALLTAEEANRYQIPIYGLMFAGVGLLLWTLAQTVFRNEKRSTILAGAVLGICALGEVLALPSHMLFLYQEDKVNVEFAREHQEASVIYWYNPNLKWMIWDDSLELMQYEQIYFADLTDPSPVNDIVSADTVCYVYCARHDNAQQALEGVLAGNPHLKGYRLIRPLLYCDLYEFY